MPIGRRLRPLHRHFRNGGVIGAGATAQIQAVDLSEACPPATKTTPVVLQRHLLLAFGGLGGFEEASLR